MRSVIRLRCFLSATNPRSAFFVRNEAVTLIQGRNSLDVLDRIVSTKITDMPDLTRRNALFCESNGRIYDMATIYTITGNVLLSSSSSGKEATRRKLVDGTSWDEDCEVLVADNAIFRISIFPYDYSVVKELFGVDLQESNTDELIEKDDHLFVKIKSTIGNIIELLVKYENLEKISSLLRDSEFKEMNSNEWDNYRIMLGITEMCDVQGNLPDEMGLGGLVSNDKGCYPGQEVHARLESRGRKIKSICRIIGDSPLNLGKQQTPDFGKISITSAGFFDGQAYALALIRLGNSNVKNIQIEGNDYSIEVMSPP